MPRSSEHHGLIMFMGPGASRTFAGRDSPANDALIVWLQADMIIANVTSTGRWSTDGETFRTCRDRRAHVTVHADFAHLRDGKKRYGTTLLGPAFDGGCVRVAEFRFRHASVEMIVSNPSSGDGQDGPVTVVENPIFAPMLWDGLGEISDTWFSVEMFVMHQVQLEAGLTAPAPSRIHRPSQIGGLDGHTLHVPGGVTHLDSQLVVAFRTWQFSSSRADSGLHVVMG